MKRQVSDYLALNALNRFTHWSKICQTKNEATGTHEAKLQLQQGRGLLLVELIF